MAATERKIPGTFAPVPGGYSQQIGANTALFIPDFSVSRYDPSTGEVYGYAPDYDALEAAKTPAVQATAPGEYSYCYEMQQAPTGCDYAADLAYYGKFDGGEIVRNAEENRLQILFDEIPNADTRDALKSNGFRWSPRNKAWQRQLTQNAEYAARRVLGL